MLARRIATLAVALAAATAGSCAGIMLPPVEMGSATASPACQAVISRVFADSGFQPVSFANQPPMAFAPRMTAPLTFVPTLGWAVGVSFSAPCAFHLQALSTEPECVPSACIPSTTPTRIPRLEGDPPSPGPLDRACYLPDPTCPMTPTGGAQYTEALVELTRRINDALAKSPAAGAGRSP